MESTSFQRVCRTLSVSAMVAGTLGMLMSFLYMDTASPTELTAGAAGFIAGSVLVGSGLISLTRIATCTGNLKKTTVFLDD